MAINLSAQAKIWSALLTSQIEENLVFKNIVTYQWEEDAKFADQVVIQTMGSVTVGDYDPNTGLSGSLQDVSITSQSIILDNQKFYNVKMDAVLTSKTPIDVMGETSRKASYSLAEAADASIGALADDLTGALGATGVGNTINIKPGATETSVSSSAYDALVNLSVILDEANAPKFGRSAIVTPWFAGDLSKDSDFVSHNRDVIQKGAVDAFGQVAGMNIYVSNNIEVSASIEYKIMAVQEESIAFIGGLNTMQVYQPELFFGSAAKGLYIYGTRVVVPTYGATLFCNNG